MSVVIIRVPSCLDINFDYLEKLKLNMEVDQYEVLHSNTEIVFYFRQLKPSELKTFDVVLQ